MPRTIQDDRGGRANSLTLPARIDNLERVFGLVQDELELRECPSSVCNQINIALEELFVNVCSYAYESSTGPGRVRIDTVFGDSPHALTVRMIDWGVPFDPLVRKDPTKPATIQEAKIGGLGIFMVKKSVDEISYQHVDGTNVVTFRKQW